MKTPAFLMAAALLFWGWRVEVPWLGVGMGLLLESARWFRLRFEFSQNDLDRIWNLCVLLFVGSAIVAFALNDGFETVGQLVEDNNAAQRLNALNKGAGTAIRFLQFLPLTLLPIVMAQAFSQRERFAWSTFSSWLRRQRSASRDRGNPDSGVNLTYPFLALTLFCSTLASATGPVFLVGFLAILVWALWSARPRGYAGVAWSACLLVALALGVAAQFGLLQVQKLIRHLDDALIAQFSSGGRNFDPKATRTRIGSIGGMKQSGRIVLRVEAGPAGPPPLLRETTYDLFRSPFWASSHREFERTLSDSVESSWTLIPTASTQSSVRIATYLDNRRGLLPVPNGTARLSELPVFLLQTNAHGVINVEEGPKFVKYTAHYQDRVSFDAPLQPEDLAVPPEESEVFRQLSHELRLDAVRPTETAERVRRFFAEKFSYSLWLGAGHRAASNRTALAAFLLDQRTGHCEYFASATVLLLRSAGIPARYAAGFAVQEKKGRYYVVRNRHAHAWCLAWIDGRWQDIDTTPGTWAATESSRASLLEPVQDLFSNAWFAFSQWRWGPGEWKRYLVWLLIPLIGIVAGRILLQKQWKRAGHPPAGQKATPPPGLDSEFYAIERRLREMGLERLDGETIRQWIQRLKAERRDLPEELPQLVQAHYRLRFDPNGLNPEERWQLRHRHRQALEKLQRVGA